MDDSMKLVFRSKISWGLLTLTLLVVLGSFSGAFILDEEGSAKWVALIGSLVTSLLVVFAFFSIRYEIMSNGILEVRSFGFFKQTIDIESIKSISKTNSLLASPAASLDRIQIKYGKASIIVSPKDVEGFIQNLRRFNSDFEVLGF
ncbi:MAG: PH domain-containing protein [Bacteroidota bacterium]